MEDSMLRFIAHILGAKNCCRHFAYITSNLYNRSFGEKKTMLSGSSIWVLNKLLHQVPEI